MSSYDGFFYALTKEEAEKLKATSEEKRWDYLLYEFEKIDKLNDALDELEDKIEDETELRKAVDAMKKKWYADKPVFFMDERWILINETMNEGIDSLPSVFPRCSEILVENGEDLFEDNEFGYYEKADKMFLKTPEQVKEIVEALSKIKKSEYLLVLKSVLVDEEVAEVTRWKEDLDFYVSFEEYLDSAWDDFETLLEFYKKSADEKRYVVFHAHFG